MRTLERPTHRDYQPTDLLGVELCQEPRRYEATMADGEVLILPSVTTILSGSGEGFTGNEATRIGTRVHALIAQHERHVMALSARLLLEGPEVRNAFGLYQAWRRGGLPPFEPLLVEVPVCSIRHGFAGTLDLLLAPGILTDHKTSAKMRPDYLTQVVAYGMALEEMLEAGTQPAAPVAYDLVGAQVARFGKDCGAPEVTLLPRDQWGPHWAKFQAKLADY